MSDKTFNANVTYRPWYGKKETIKTVPFSNWIKLDNNWKHNTECITANQIVKLYFDLDAEFRVDTQPDRERLDAKRDEFIQTIHNKYGGDECSIVDFSSWRENKKNGRYYKYSTHLIFPQIVVSNSILQKFSNEKLVRSTFGNLEWIDPAAYRNVGLFRQFGLAKPYRDSTGFHTMNETGNLIDYKNGRLTEWKSPSIEAYYRSLVGTVDEQYTLVDITEELTQSVLNFNPTLVNDESSGIVIPIINDNKTLINQPSRKLRSIPKKFRDKFEQLDNGSRFITATVILYNLPENYAKHDRRIKLYPVIKKLETNAGIQLGELYMDWLTTIRTDLSDRDYLDNYLKTNFDPAKIEDFLPQLLSIKKEENLLVFSQEKSIVDAQKLFTNNTIKPKYSSISEFSAFIIQNRDIELDESSNRKDQFIFTIFSHICVSHADDGEEIIVYKTLEDNNNIIYKQILRKKRGALNRPLFTITVGKKMQTVSFLFFYERDEHLFTRTLSYLGPWINNSMPIVNISPSAKVIAHKTDVYDDWLTKFKSYFYSVFLGNEQNQNQIFTYIMSWYKHMIFKSTPTRKILVFTDKVGGLGKSLMFSNIPAYITDPYYIRLVKGSFGSMINGFNELRPKQKLIVLEESEQYDNSSNKNFDTLKEMITSRELQITQKYKDTKFVKNTVNYVILTNNSNPILTGINDRRVVFIKLKNPAKTLSERNRIAANFAELMIDNLSNFVWYLKNECDDWKLHANDAMLTNSIQEQDKLKTAVMSSTFLNDLVSGIDYTIRDDDYEDVREPIVQVSDNNNINFGFTQIRTLLNSRENNVRNYWTNKRIKINSIKDGFTISTNRERFTSYDGSRVRSIRYSISADLLQESIQLPFNLSTDKMDMDIQQV